MRRAFAFVILLTVLSASLAGCGTTPATPTAAPTAAANNPATAPAATEIAAPTAPAATEAAAPAAPKVLRYVYSYGPTTLDTSQVADNQSGVALFNTSEGLLRYYDGKIQPGMAESHEVSADQLTYTFHLRDAKWQDDVAITAKDFEYSIKRLLTPETASPMASSYYMIKNAAGFNGGTETDWSKVGVKATDDKTLVIALEYPVPYFLTSVATSSNMYPLRQDFVESAGEAYATDPAHYLASGPFLLNSFVSEQEITYTKNPKFWNAAAIKLDKIEMTISMDANTNIAMFDNDEIDLYLEIDPVAFPNYDPGKPHLINTLQFLQFNMQGTSAETGKVMSNLNFQKALSYAFDRKAYLVATQGEKSPSSVATRIAGSFYSGVNGSFIDENPVTEQFTTYDPEKAKEYLAAAFKELGTTADKLPELTYLTFEGNKMKSYAEGLLDAWNRVLGLKNITVKQLPIPNAIQAMYQGQFDIYFQAMSTDVDLGIFLEYFTTGNALNLSKWSDPKYDELVAVTKTTTDPATRNKALAAAEQYLMDYGPMAPLFQQGAYTGLAKPGFTGLVVSGIGATEQFIYADKTN